MQKYPDLQIGDLKFILKISKKSRRIRLSVYPDGRITVGVPISLDISVVEQFIKDRMSWILEKLKKFTPFRPVVRRKNSQVEYRKYKESARNLVNERISVLNKHYHFNIGNVSIKNQKSRWGSCSAKGNLNFNYKIVFLPKELVDYIIIHELCHLRELNHSNRFWKLVSDVAPNYLKLRSELKKQGLALG